MAISTSSASRYALARTATGPLAGSDSLRLLKQAIWLYFFLLLFEGGLRRWVLPGLAAPLLIVRDPVAIWLVYTAWKKGLLPANSYLSTMVFIGIAGIFTATLFCHGNLFVALYGARIMLVHFPLIFVIGRIFDRSDVIKMGHATVLLTIPMAILLALQFYSPQSAWVNRGVGGSLEGAGFNGGALGYFRPPGTFSFINGTSLFFGFAAAYIFYFWLHPGNFNRLILIGASAGLLIAVPLSISRTLFFYVLISAVFAVGAIMLKPKYIGKLIFAGIGMLFVLAILSQASFFQTAIAAFTARFEGAEKWEGGLQGTLGHRYLGGLASAFTNAGSLPFFGYGLGFGSNVGSTLLNGITGRFLSEDDWPRTVEELGPLLGVAMILVRVGLSIKIALASYKRMLVGDLLPWLLLSFGLLVLPQGEWAQATSLGFSTLISGLMIASLRQPRPAVAPSSHASTLATTAA